MYTLDIFNTIIRYINTYLQQNNLLGLSTNKNLIDQYIGKIYQVCT